MNFPIDFHFGSITIPSHPVFELLAFILAYRYFIYLKTAKKTTPFAPDGEWWLIAGVAIGGLIGSRIVAALENPDMFLHSYTWLYYIGGQTIAGGVAGGIIGIEIVKKILHIKRKTGDLFVYPLMLGIIIGRIGCFLTGVKDGTVGLPSNLPWAFDQGDGIPRHPTSLYEILFLIILWIVIKKIENKKIIKEGDLFGIFAFSYGLFRFLVEFIKPRDTLWLGLSSIQLLGAALVIYYSLYFIKRYKK